MVLRISMVTVEYQWSAWQVSVSKVAGRHIRSSVRSLHHHAD
jgi:hypothetical protein